MFDDGGFPSYVDAHRFATPRCIADPSSDGFLDNKIYMQLIRHGVGFPIPTPLDAFLTVHYNHATAIGAVPALGAETIVVDRHEHNDVLSILASTLSDN